MFRPVRRTISSGGINTIHYMTVRYDLADCKLAVRIGVMLLLSHSFDVRCWCETRSEYR